ncbi:hypothetical protein EYZ11_001101 [Aspergillus tanneri]|uniref:Uncharacterized protein n=1 Tax=Aspergillus tanneri TaxID=1220188 RepID=A0A4S3JVE9_9EURO|nr:hypothetical protein EYZ11_001101 [Aspergillus tanneri]
MHLAQPLKIVGYAEAVGELAARSFSMVHLAVNMQDDATHAVRPIWLSVLVFMGMLEMENDENCDYQIADTVAEWYYRFRSLAGIKLP